MGDMEATQKKNTVIVETSEMFLSSNAAQRTTLKKIGFAKNNVTVRCMLGLFLPFAKQRTMFVCTFIPWARKMSQRRTSPI